MKKMNKRYFSYTTALAVTALMVCSLTGCSKTPSAAQAEQSSDSAEVGGEKAGGENIVEESPEGSTSDSTGSAAETTYPKMQIDMACNNTNSPDESLLLKFADLIEERSGGAITAVVFSGTLGSELEIDEQIRSGTIHMYVSATSTISTYAPEYNTFSVPYVYSDRDQVMASWKSSIGEGLRANYEAADIYTSADTLFIRGMRELTSNKLVKTADEVRGLKLRLPSTSEWVTVWSKMGANVATISSSEVFSALQTGVVDAQENPIISNYNKGLQEVQKYTIMTDHIVDLLPVIYSKKWFDGLDADTQALVSACIDDATDWANEYAAELTESNKAEMEAAGMEFVEVDTSSFKEIALSCLDELSENWADGIYEQLMKDIS